MSTTTLTQDEQTRLRRYARSYQAHSAHREFSPREVTRLLFTRWRLQAIELELRNRTGGQS